jgi:hypothetical protein
MIHHLQGGVANTSDGPPSLEATCASSWGPKATCETTRSQGQRVGCRGGGGDGTGDGASCKWWRGRYHHRHIGPSGSTLGPPSVPMERRNNFVRFRAVGEGGTHGGSRRNTLHARLQSKPGGATGIPHHFTQQDGALTGNSARK